jgi:hypothetical protein
VDREIAVDFLLSVGVHMCREYGSKRSNL